MSERARRVDPRVGPIEPLRERFPDYAATFTVGLAIMLVLGLLWGLASEASLLEGMAWSLMLGGVLLLLIGGATGGGYANLGLGAMTTVFGGRQNYDEDVTDEDIRRGKVKKRDAGERLRKGLRPPPNPTAFWQVIGGICYIALGVFLLETLAG